MENNPAAFLDVLGLEVFVALLSCYILHVVCLQPKFNIPHYLCFNNLLVIVPDEKSLLSLDSNPNSNPPHTGKRRSKKSPPPNPPPRPSKPPRTVQGRLNALRWQTSRVATGELVTLGFWPIFNQVAMMTLYSVVAFFTVETYRLVITMANHRAPSATSVSTFSGPCSVSAQLDVRASAASHRHTHHFLVFLLLGNLTVSFLTSRSLLIAPSLWGYAVGGLGTVLTLFVCHSPVLAEYTKLADATEELVSERSERILRKMRMV